MDVLALVLMLAVFLVSVSIHESAHAYAAYRLGDDTAARLGRISLNPLRHIDPIMTVVVPVILALTIGIPFGGAKPVPVVTAHLREPRRDMMWIAWAGPASNLAQALVFAAFWFLFSAVDALVPLPVVVKASVYLLCLYGVLVNLVLGGFNMIPVPPLDGSRILAALVPDSVAQWLDRLEPVGLFLVLGLIMFGVTEYFLAPLERVAEYLIGLPGLLF